jgi:RNA polymerase sigma-70 factor (ECF subfamily)
LYRIATNEAITFLQNRKRHYSTGIDEGDNPLTARLRADSWFDGDAVQQQLQEAITQLPDKQRTVFNLRYYDEMPYEEMSRVLDTSVGALKASFHHAAKKIETYFREADHF